MQISQHNQDKQKTNVSPGKLSWLRTKAGMANLGNSMTHILLVVYIKANEDNDSDYWIAERKLGGLEGPLILAGINFFAVSNTI